MKAIVFERFGGPEVLELADVRNPIPAHGEILIRSSTVDRLQL